MSLNITGKIVHQRYGTVSIVLHWAMFLIIAATYSCILLRENFPRGSDIREGLKAWHFMLGLTILLLFFIRIIARYFTSKPPITPAPSRWQMHLSKGVHWALYAFMLAMPLLGWSILRLRTH